MIKSTTYKNSVVIAKELSEKGISLDVTESSPLGVLLDLSASVNTVKTTDAPKILSNPRHASENYTASVEARSSVVEYSTANGDSASQHSMAIDALAEDISKHVTAHLSHARTVVTPLVVSMATKLEKFLQDAAPVDPSTNFDIIVCEVPELLLDEAFFADSLEQYEGVEVAEYYPQPLQVSPAINKDDAFYANLVLLGNDRLNGLVAKWLLTKDKNFIKNRFEAIFGFPGALVEERDLYSQLDNMLATFIIANRLFAEPISVEGTTAVEYKTTLRKTIDYAAYRILQILRTIKRQIETNILVTEAVLSKRRIVVHRPLYTQYLTNGGSPEALLGMLVSGKVIFNVGVIAESKDDLVRYWHNYVMLSQSDVKAELQKRFVDYLRSEMAMSLNELTPSEKEFSVGVADFTRRIMDKVEDEITHLGHRIRDDVYHTALHVVAKARFYYTSAYWILRDIAEAGKVDGNSDVREAALIATINYVADYLEHQITSNKGLH